MRIRKICYVVTIPTTIRSFFMSQLQYLAKHGFDVSVICARDEKLLEDLTVIDVPLTLSAAYRSVELALGVDYIGIEEIMELAKEKELNNFIKTVNNLILEDIYTRKSVSVRKVYKDKL